MRSEYNEQGKFMIKTTLKIDGMMCGMCEAHVNDAIRGAISVKKVTSSHRSGETVVISEASIDRERLKEAIEKTGYRLLSVSETPYVKKSFLSFLKK